jgi:hypothetical protein
MGTLEGMWHSLKNFTVVAWESIGPQTSDAARKPSTETAREWMKSDLIINVS